MPLVSITHSIDRPGVEQDLSESVHEALVEAFGIPSDDYFHVVTSHGQTVGLFGPRSFLNVEHTAAMVFVQIACAPGRSVEQKKSLYDQMASRLASTGHVRRQDVIINLVEAARENWSFGDGVAQFAP